MSPERQGSFRAGHHLENEVRRQRRCPRAVLLCSFFLSLSAAEGRETGDGGRRRITVFNRKMKRVFFLLIFFFIYSLLKKGLPEVRRRFWWCRERAHKGRRPLQRKVTGPPPTQTAPPTHLSDTAAGTPGDVVLNKFDLYSSQTCEVSSSERPHARRVSGVREDSSGPLTSQREPSRSPPRAESPTGQGPLCPSPESGPGSGVVRWSKPTAKPAST